METKTNTNDESCTITTVGAIDNCNVPWGSDWYTYQYPTYYTWPYHWHTPTFIENRRLNDWLEGFLEGKKKINRVDLEIIRKKMKEL